MELGTSPPVLSTEEILALALVVSSSNTEHLRILNSVLLLGTSGLLEGLPVVSAS